MKSDKKTTIKFVNNRQIMIFLSYCLIDIEIQYKNSEHKCLMIVKCLTKIKWLVINNSYKIFIYFDPCILQNIFLKDDNKKVKINA